jgi:ABC-2 type transport system permease protein
MGVGDLLGLPRTVRNISPFTHVPAIPAVDLEPTPRVALLFVAAVLVAAGMTLFS